MCLYAAGSSPCSEGKESFFSLTLLIAHDVIIICAHTGGVFANIYLSVFKTNFGAIC